MGQHSYGPIQFSLPCNFCFGVTVFCWPAYSGVPDHPWFDPALAPASGTLPRATEVGLLPASDQIGGFNLTVPSFGPSFALRKHERPRRTHHLRRLACPPGGLRFAYCESCRIPSAALAAMIPGTAVAFGPLRRHGLVGDGRWCGGSRNDPAMGKIEVVVAGASGSGGVPASV